MECCFKFETLFLKEIDNSFQILVFYQILYNESYEPIKIKNCDKVLTGEGGGGYQIINCAIAAANRILQINQIFP